ncbi:MAG TPA: hypothetical protein VJP89_09350 [Pyrinomonadaceae bacterium]|nr:hypothetical protein [Pyrinomonadaceae bacterium]
MKRCPQCEFIYEDDQSLCDMDGALLVFDSRSLPNLHALAPVDVPAPVAAKAHWRHRTFPAMAALILATVLSLVYFVSTQRGVSPTAPVNVPSVTLPASKLAAPVEANPTPEPPPPPTEANSAAPVTKEEVKPEKPTTQPASKAKTSKTSITQPKPTQESKKDDSKVGSILKKTGRILKKPFKF